ncbi:hypothetical protein HYW19_00255 [Candidatus Woesearchaeota archaeon]|nr:hypothetical protein [Candidatus Woesearchaeota archaeon]
MKEIVKKSFLLGLGAATLTKKQVEKTVKDLVRKNAVTLKESSDILKKIGKAADAERKRVSKFAQQEAARISSQMGVASKTQLNKVKKKLKSIDKELSRSGKKTLKSILRQLSK